MFNNTFFYWAISEICVNFTRILYKINLHQYLIFKTKKIT
jgi:hypothetical protein